MKHMLENGAALPSVSGIQPMAEQVYGSRNEQAEVLMRLLGEFDRLIGGVR